MNKATILVTVGILLLILGLVTAFFAATGLTTHITASNTFSHIYTYLIDAGIAIAFLVVGGLLVIFGIKKS